MSTGWKMGAPSMITANPNPMIKPCRHSTLDSLSRSAMTFLRKGRSQAKYLTTRTPPKTSFITFTLLSACLRYSF